MRVEHTLVEVAQAVDQQGGGWRADSVLAEQVEEALARVPLRRRRVLLGVLDGLTQRQAVVSAGYHVGSPQSASQIAQQIMRDPAVQHAYQALLEARGLSGAKLDQIHAAHLSRHSSPDGGDRDRSLRALALARKYTLPKPSPDAKPLADQLLDEMSPAELRRFAERQEWPAWAADRLRRAGFSLRRNGAATTLDEIPGAPPADPPAGAGSVDDDARLGDGESADRSAPGGDLARDRTDAEPPPPARPPRAPEPVPTPPSPIAARVTDPSVPGGEPAVWRRPEDRVWPPPPPASRATDLLAEIERDQVPVARRDWYKRDCRW